MKPVETLEARRVVGPPLQPVFPVPRGIELKASLHAKTPCGQSVLTDSTGYRFSVAHGRCRRHGAGRRAESEMEFVEAG